MEVIVVSKPLLFYYSNEMILTIAVATNAVTDQSTFTL